MRAMVYRGPVPGPRRREGHPGDRAPERRDRPGHLRRDLRLGPAPLPRHDARHPRRAYVRPRVHRRRRRGRPVGARTCAVGDRVMVPFNICCGSCFFCARGLYSNCHNVNPNATAVGGIYGYSHTCGGYDGGQAEFVRVPFADVGPSRSPTGWTKRTPCSSPTRCPTGYFGAAAGRHQARATSWSCSAPGRSGCSPRSPRG